MAASFDTSVDCNRSGPKTRLDWLTEAHRPAQGGAGTAGATVAVVGDCLVAPAPGFAPEADLAAFLAAAATGGKQVRRVCARLGPAAG